MSTATTSAPAKTATKKEGDAAIATVTAFLEALERLDVEAATALMADDIEYTNVPFPAARGRDATVRALKSFLVLAKGFEVENHNVAAHGGTVLTERTDYFTNGPFRAGFWVCGTFEVEDGKITVWRDRFDFVAVTFGLIKGIAMIPFRLGR